MEELGEMKRFALLLCAEDSDYVKKKYGGYFGVFVRMLAEDGEIWDVFRVCSGHFPSDEEIGLYDGFVITGSCSDAHGNDAWILARALGGKVARAKSGWDIGIRTIHFSTSINTFANNVKLPARLSLIECHRDEVWELPSKVQVLASSDKTKVEMFKYGDHIMGVQGHPEYTKDILTHLIDRLLQRDDIEESYAIKGRDSVNENEPDREAWKQLCTGFLKGRL
ncbi:hypothetical protein E3N88_27926 [Mikania micrantha]|uniref:Glutamine amidotransferase domain-containing protein n=1 Tax=Mikania micrantha TaxID=192012 RepID=A0A5N6N0W9_9ASTR|nr:hypothetical protein E3N88_27926 [Mikania micrantha]